MPEIKTEMTDPAFRRDVTGASPAHDEMQPSSLVEDELPYRLRQQRLLAEFGLHALRITDRGDVLQEATRIAAEGLAVGFAKYLEYRSGTDDLLVVAGVGWRPGVVGHATFVAHSSTPPGHAFLSGQSVLTNDLVEDTRFEVPQLLIDHGISRAINVPVRDGGRPIGVLEVDARGSGRFTEADTAFLEGLGTFVSVSMRRLGAEAALEEAAARERHLAGELRHRVRNIFTVIRGLIAMTRREVAAEGGDLAELLSGRMDALSAAAEAGLPDLNDGVGHGAPADVGVLAGKVLAPYAGQINIRPPTTPAPPLAGDRQTPMALLLHELTTNALKHGALAHPDGRVVLTLANGDDGLRVEWREALPPGMRIDPDEAPVPGFGTAMIDRLVGATEGRIKRIWTAGGLAVEVFLPARA